MFATREILSQTQQPNPASLQGLPFPGTFFENFQFADRNVKASKPALKANQDD
jgi:hypothetical protein